jgi:hypothetical protein
VQIPFRRLAHKMMEQESACGASDMVTRPFGYSGKRTFQSFVPFFLKGILPGRGYHSSAHEILSARRFRV